MTQEIKVRLDEHWGTPVIESPNGQKRVRLPQYMVMIQDYDLEDKWHFSGFVGEHEGAHFNLMVSGYTTKEVEIIRQKVAEAKAALGIDGGVSNVAQIKPLAANDYEPVRETTNPQESDVI